METGLNGDGVKGTRGAVLPSWPPHGQQEEGAEEEE